jgi:hypothetical protein
MSWRPTNVRRFLLALAVVCGLSSPAWAAIAFVQDDGTSFDPFGDVRAITFGSSTASGSLIIGVFNGENSGTLTCSDNKSNSYSTVAFANGFAHCVAYNVTGGASHQITFTITSSANSGRIIVFEFSGAATAAGFDETCEHSEFVANVSCTTGVTDEDDELVFATISVSVSVTAGSGFTLGHTQDSVKTEYKVGAAAGAQLVQFTHAEATADLLATTYKAAGGAPPASTACRNLLLLGVGGACN